jgi:hypothetical protein
MIKLPPFTLACCTPLITIAAVVALCEATSDLTASQKPTAPFTIATLPSRQLSPLAATSLLPVVTGTPSLPPTLSLADLERREFFIIDSFQGRPDEAGFPAMALEVVSHEGESLGILKDGPGPDARLSPGGTMLAYTTRPQDPSSWLALFRITNLRSQDTWTLPGSHTITGFSWSPDERRMVVAIDGNITLVTPGQTEILPLVDCGNLGEAGECDWPEWSPDGNWVAYYLAVGAPNPDPRVGFYLLPTRCFSTPSSCMADSVGPFFSSRGGVRLVARWGVPSSCQWRHHLSLQ